jgi:hypothetical protein
MKTTRRIFIKQSTVATIAALGAGSLAWTEFGCAQTQPIAGDVPAKKFGDVGFDYRSISDSARDESIWAADTTAEINRVPYLSQYYIAPKADLGKDVTISYYVTDYLQKEFMQDDHSETFTLDYWVNGKKQSVANVKAGDNSFVLKGLSKGKVLLAFQATDSKGRKSHRLFQEFLVVDPKEEAIPPSKVLHPDLKQFGIYNDDTHPVETTAGLTKMLQWAHDNGYRKVLLPQGRYRLDENETVQMATNLTLDMNGSTFKLNPNALDKAMMFAMVECTDSHVINGTFEGDLKEHDFKTAPNNSEWVCAVMIGQGSSYCSYENVKVVDVTGYGTNTTMGSAGSKKPKYGYSAVIVSPGIFSPGDVDVQGNPIASDVRLINAKPVDISKFVETLGYLQLGKYLGYQGNPSGSWIYKASFYDANNKFLETIESYMYRKVYIPAGAKFVRFVLLSNVDPARVKDMSVFNFQQPYNCVFRNIDHINVRCVGMCPSGFYNLLAEGCTFENCGSSSAKCAFDSEDGWDMMQDLTFRNNTFGKNPHNEFLTADGDNFVIENNTLSTYMWDRTRGSVYRNNKFRTGGYGSAGFNLGTRQRSGYPRISNNIIDGTTKLIGATGTPNCEYRIVNNQCRGSVMCSRGMGNAATAAYFYDCKIDGGGVAGKAVKCDLKDVNNGGGVVEIYDSTLSDSQIKTSGPDSLSKIIRCTIKNCQWVNINNNLLMKGNTITDIEMSAGGGWQENIVCVYLDNIITTSFSHFVSLGNSFKAVVFDNNTVTSTDPKFIAINTINPQAKTNKALMVAVTKSTFTGKGGTVFNIGFVPAAGTLLSLYAKDNKYTGVEAINPKAFNMKTVKMVEEYPPTA